MIAPYDVVGWTHVRGMDPDNFPEQSRYKHDSDLDGIPNDYDACPSDAEDFDGDRDTDGCPE